MLPKLPGNNTVMRAAGYVLNDWQLSGIYTGSSGNSYDLGFSYNAAGSKIIDTGWRSLFVGMCFLTIATAIGELIRHTFEGGFLSNVANGLEIFGWVALWRPAELLLYEWTPVYRQRLLMERLASAEVELLSE